MQSYEQLSLDNMYSMSRNNINTINHYTINNTINYQTINNTINYYTINNTINYYNNNFNANSLLSRMHDHIDGMSEHDDDTSAPINSTIRDEHVDPIKKSFENIINSENNECSICLSNNNQEWLRIKCNHEFCKKCITTWFKTNPTCPLCRNK
jgi:hypothetical protein